MGLVVQATPVFGMSALDDEHQATTEGIQKLASSLNGAVYRPEETESALDHLIVHLSAHFLNEEAWMQEMEYPGFQAHKSQHENLITVLKEFLEEFKASPTHCRGQKLHKLLEEWLSHHTLQSDSLAGKYLLRRLRA